MMTDVPARIQNSEENYLAARKRVVLQTRVCEIRLRAFSLDPTAQNAALYQAAHAVLVDHNQDADWWRRAADDLRASVGLSIDHQVPLRSSGEIINFPSRLGADR